MKKMINKKLYYFLIPIIVIIGVFYIFLYNDQEKNISKEDVVTYIIKARLANKDFNYKEATKFYELAYKADSSSPELLEEYLLFSIMQRNLDKSFELSQKVIVQSHSHFLANLILLVEDIRSGKIDSAIANLSSTAPEKDSINELVLGFFKSYQAIQNNDYKAFEDINQAHKELAMDLYLYQKGLLSLRFEKQDIAEKTFLELNSSYVNLESIILYSQILYNKDEEAGVKYFKDYLSDNFLSSSKTQEYIKRHTRVNDTFVFSDLIFRLAKMMSLELNPIYLYSDSIALSNIALMLNEDNIPAKMDVAAFYFAVGDYNSSIKMYKEIPFDSYYSREAVHPIVDIYRELGKEKELIKYLQDYYVEDKDNAQTLIELGLSFHRDKQYKKAIQNYTKALDISSKNEYKLGLWLSYFFRGISYDKINDWEMAEKDLLEAQKINSSDPLLVNYLAYSWITRDKNIDISMKMLSEALVYAKDNPNLLDSYAWGLFKTAKYEEALQYSEKANILLPYNAILLDHLGDILWQLGDKKESVLTWKKALNFASDNELEKSISAKISGDFPSYLDKNVKEKPKSKSFVDKVRNSK